MSMLHLTRHSSAPPGVVWEVLTDFRGYRAWMPLTTVRVDPGAPRVGWCFVGLTGVGPLRFADPMLVAVWEPPLDDPRVAAGAVHADAADHTGASGRTGAADRTARGRFRVVKIGRLLDGSAEVEVVPSGDGSGGSEVRWTQDLRIRHLPQWLTGPVMDRAAGLVYARALDAMLAEAAQRPGAAR